MQLNDFSFYSLNILFGKNGSGKSTLLDQLAGVRGNGNIFGSRSVAYKMQKNYYFPFLTVAQTLALYEAMTIDEQHKVWLEQFYQENIQKIMNLKMGNLSGDQRQIVLNYGILLLKRDVYLLDEPLAGLDEQNSKLLYEVFEKIAKAKDKMIVIVEHNSSIIESYRSLVNVIKV